MAPGRWFALAILFAASGCLISRAPREKPAYAPQTIAITSVNVLPMTAGEPILRDQIVVVANGRIKAVGPSASARPPKGALRLDGQGKYLMPGLADMHAHLEYFDNPAYLKLFLLNGVTAVRSMDGRPKILDWKRQAEAGTLDGPDIHTAGPILDGVPPRRDDNLALATPAEAREAVAQQAAAGYDFIKVYTNLSPSVFQSVMQEASARGMPVAGHVPLAVGLDAFLQSGVKSIEHLGDFAQAIAAPPPSADAAPDVLKRRLGFPVDEARIDAMAAQVAASGIWAVPTLILDDRSVAPPANIARWMRAPETATVDRGMLRYWRGSAQRSGERVGENGWNWIGQGRVNRLALVRAFHRYKVPLLIGTDAPNPFVFVGSSVHDELANFVAAGLTNRQALAAATREPARFLGQSRDWGTVEPGKRAHLLLLNANPLEDIGATRSIAGVISGGRWFDTARLDAMKRELEGLAASSD